MKLNISFGSFKKNHKSKKDQLIYKVKSCKDYKQVENGGSKQTTKYHNGHGALNFVARLPAL